MGLTPDSVRKSPKFQKAKADYERATNEIKKFLKGVPKDYLSKRAKARRMKRFNTNESLEEKNEPTNPALWAKFKAQAKAKFDVYPSAYANGWAAKQYKAAGGGWKTTKESIDEAKYEVKNGKIHISKSEFRKVHRDFKNTTRGKERMMASGKGGAATSYPVVFTEETISEMAMPRKEFEKLKKGDKLKFTFDSSMKKGHEVSLVVTGKSRSAKYDVDKVNMKDAGDPRNRTKFTLYSRKGGDATLAWGDAATVMQKYVKESLHKTDSTAWHRRCARKHGLGKPNKAADDYISKMMKKYGAKDMADLKKKMGIKEDLSENFRTLATKGMGAEKKSDIKVGHGVDYYDKEAGNKHTGKIVKMGPKSYQVRDEKTGKIHTFDYYDPAKARKMMKESRHRRTHSTRTRHDCATQGRSN